MKWIKNFSPVYHTDGYSIRLSDDPTVGWELRADGDIIKESTDFMELVDFTGFPYSEFYKDAIAECKLEKSLHLLLFDVPIANFRLVGDGFECFVGAYEFGSELEIKESIFEAKKWCEERYDFYLKKMINQA